MASSKSQKKKKQQRGGGGGPGGGGGESRVSSWSSSSPSLLSHENETFWDLPPGTSKNCCFVTVGTTSFDLLTGLFIHPEDSSIYEPLLEQLVRLKVTHLVVQRGRGYGIYHGEHMMLEKDNDNVIYKIPYSTFGIADSIEEIFFNSDIVITHAGAGSIFEALSFGKKVIAVTNPGLMGNHQAELADELAKRRHIVTVHGPENLVDALKTVDLDALEPYVPGNPATIANEINKLIGDYPLQRKILKLAQAMDWDDAPANDGAVRQPVPPNGVPPAPAPPGPPGDPPPPIPPNGVPPPPMPPNGVPPSVPPMPQQQ